jgi:hypothetical protein
MKQLQPLKKINPAFNIIQLSIKSFLEKNIKTELKISKKPDHESYFFLEPQRKTKELKFTLGKVTFLVDDWHISVNQYLSDYKEYKKSKYHMTMNLTDEKTKEKIVARIYTRSE